MVLKPNVWVLRLGHRFVRDDRATTHLGLVARAFGASGIYIVGGESKLKVSLFEVKKRWGGTFKVELIDHWKELLAGWIQEGKIVVHLTMYGLPLDEAMGEVRSFKKDILVIVGSEKVPRAIYKLSNYNISVGNQPHSEIAALAVFLDRLYRGEELKASFCRYKLRIVPNACGKTVEERR